MTEFFAVAGREFLSRTHAVLTESFADRTNDDQARDLLVIELSGTRHSPKVLETTTLVRGIVNALSWFVGRIG